MPSPDPGLRPQPSDAGRRDCDVIVIGAGPAGLTAALYLQRFRRHVRVVDAGASRARHIPLSRNCPAFPHGVSGRDYLDDLRLQCERHGLHAEPGEVTDLRRHEGTFVAALPDGPVRSRAVIIATGIADVLPPIPDLERALLDGTVRLCPVCDALETAGQSLVVYGPSGHAAAEALYLRSFCVRVTLASSTLVAPRTLRELIDAGVRVLEQAGTPVLCEGRVRITDVDGTVHAFDAVYPAMSARPRGALAERLGAACSTDGYVRTDAHQQTGVPGLYAVGDVAEGLNQIAVAAGQAATAASAVHRQLPACRLEE